VRSAQRIDRGEPQASAQQQQQRGRNWRTRADPLAEVWDSVLLPMLEKAPQLEPQTLLHATGVHSPSAMDPARAGHLGLTDLGLYMIPTCPTTTWPTE